MLKGRFTIPVSPELVGEGLTFIKAHRLPQRKQLQSLALNWHQLDVCP